MRGLHPRGAPRLGRTTGAAWPDVALAAAQQFIAALAEVGADAQAEDEIATTLADLAADVVQLAREARMPVRPELERLVALYEADRAMLFHRLPSALARAGLGPDDRAWLAARGVLVAEDGSGAPWH